MALARDGFLCVETVKVKGDYVNSDSAKRGLAMTLIAFVALAELAFGAAVETSMQKGSIGNINTLFSLFHQDKERY
jgi:hypothetical protein